MSEMFSRRSFLKLSGALVAASALAACSGGGSSSSPVTPGGDVPSTSRDIDGLLLGKDVVIATPNNQLLFTMSLKNTTGSSITISKGDFQNIFFNQSRANAQSVGTLSTLGDTYTIDSGKTESVSVLFDFVLQPNQDYSVSFDLVHGKKKAVFTGTVPNSTWSVSIKDKDSNS